MGTCVEAVQGGEEGAVELGGWAVTVDEGVPLRIGEEETVVLFELRM